MKYVRHEELGIFLFPNTGRKGINYKDITEFIEEAIRNGEIISAGFADFRDGYFICHECSQSIGLRVLDDDNKILNEQFNIEMPENR